MDAGRLAKTGELNMAQTAIGAAKIRAAHLGMALADFQRRNIAEKCVECRGVIEPGTRHARIAGATNGRIWVERECLDCKELSDELWTLLAADNLHPEDGPTFGDLACWIHENDEDERLSPEGRARLKALDERLSTHG